MTHSGGGLGRSGAPASLNAALRSEKASGKGGAVQGEAGGGPGVERTEGAPASEVTRNWNSKPNVLNGSQRHAQVTSVPVSMLFVLHDVLLPLSAHPNLPTFKGQPHPSSGWKPVPPAEP